MLEASLPGRPTYRFGPFCLDVNERRLRRGDRTIPVQSKIFDTLLVLVENSGRLLEKAELMELVWPDATVEESNLTHNLSILRKTLGTSPSKAPYIVTVPGKGYRFTAPVEASLEPSIAVLPFVNMSSDPEQDFFCDGMAEELINALSQVAGLKIVARTSSFQFRRRELDVKEVGQKLGVSALLEGSVRKSGNRLRITAQLIRAADGYHLWSGRYDREFADVFAIQDEITRAIVEHVRTEMLGPPAPPMVKRPTQNQEVYHLYLEARFHRADESRVGTERAIGLLERALALEPNFAPGYALLASCYTTLSIYGLVPLEEALPRAERAAARALELDESLADAHRALGALHACCYWDWPATERALHRALELDPRSPGSHCSYAANFLAPVGRLEEAEREMRIALDLDPLAPFTSRVMAQILYWSRQHDSALGQLRHTLELDPDFPLARTLLAAVYEALGRPDDAIRERQVHLRRVGRHEAAEDIGRIYEVGGEEGVLRWQLEGGLVRAKTGRGHPYNLALLYSRLGDKESSFHWLEEALARKGGLTLYAKVHPWLDNLRSDPRFDAFLDRMGVNDSQVASPRALA